MVSLLEDDFEEKFEYLEQKFTNYQHNLKQMMLLKLTKSLGKQVTIQKFDYFQEVYEITLREVRVNGFLCFDHFVRINNHTKKMEGKLYLQHNSLHKHAKTKHLCLLLLRYMLKLNKIYSRGCPTISLNPQNGLIMVRYSLHLQVDIWNSVNIIIQQIVTVHRELKPLYYYVLNLINQLPSSFLSQIDRKNYFSKEINAESQIQFLMYKYSNLSIAEFFLSQSTNPIESNICDQRVQINQKIQNQDLPSIEGSTREIYWHDAIYAKCAEKNRLFSLQMTEYTNVKKNFLELPKFASQYPENPYVFNFIAIPELNKFDAKQFPPTHNSKNKIFLSKVKYTYMQETLHAEKDTKNFQKTKLKPVHQCLTKMMAIKVPQRKDDPKAANQLSIVKMLSLGSSVFLPKYYICKDNNFKYQNLLMMDFIHPAESLHTYLRKWENTLSFISKVYLLVNVVQGLRFLREYQITHMDLSMSNILVLGNMITKLIDFGQSYHQSLPEINHGFTLPFTFPELFSTKSYNHKCDMYSFGIILFKAIFERYPFTDDFSLLPYLLQNSYDSIFYFAPESASYYGYEKQISFILAIIFKCLSPEQKRRPQPKWLIIILKYTFFWIEDFYGLL